jgi:hypothetical protein
MRKISLTRRVTSSFIDAIPKQYEDLQGCVYAIVQRKPEKVVPDSPYGIDVRLEPCSLNLAERTIKMTLPLDLNEGIHSFEDLDPHFFEAVEAAFLVLIQDFAR